MERAIVRPTDRVCGSCKYWSPMSDFEGLCTCSEGLISATIDVTEIRYSCPRWISCFAEDSAEEYVD